VSLVLLVLGLALSAVAHPRAHALILAGISTVLALPVLQAFLALLSFRWSGDRRFAAVALGLLAVQALAVAVAFA
jgi:uncharacterized membrane protein